MSPEELARRQLAGLRELGAERLAAARRGDWQTLERLEAQRREALAGLAPAGLSALATAVPWTFAALADELAEGDRLVECALRSALAARKAALTATRTQARAERSYLKASRSTS